MAISRARPDVSHRHFDALRVKIRDADSRMVKNKAVYVALGVSRDVLIAVVDGLKGFPEAITAAFPEAAVQDTGLVPDGR